MLQHIYNYIDFTVSTAGYYQALVWPETKIISGPCGSIGWTVTGTSSFTNNVVFYEKSKPTSNFNINGLTTDPCTNEQVNVFTCGQFNLNNLSTGYPNEYRVSYTQYTSECDGVLTGGYSDFGDWKPGNPTTINMHSEFPGIFTNDDYVGWYKVKLEVRNSCGTSSKQMCFRLNTINTASVNYKFVNSGGIATINVSATCTSAPTVGKINCTLNGSSSSGTIDKYWIKINEYSSCGTFTKTVADGSDQTDDICDLTELAALNLNNYVFYHWDMGGTPDDLYFYNNPDKRFYITVYVSNQCGTASKSGWFRNNGAWKEGDFENTVELNLIPNPVSSSAEIIFTVEENGPVSISIFDMQGKEIMQVLNEIHYAAGSYSLNINTESLQAGMYFCKMTGSSIFETSFIKQ